MIRVIFVLALLLAAPTLNAAKTPTEASTAKRADTAATQAHAAQPPGSSKSLPLYVVPECERGCGYSDDHQSFLRKIWTDPVAAFTAILAVSTTWLWWVTRSMAITSKRALLDLERPIVFGGVSSPGIKLDTGGLHRSRLDLSIYNHGRTIARLRRISWRVELAPTGTIPDAIDPKKTGGLELPAGTVCVSGDPYGESENLFAKFNVTEVAAITKGDLSVWVVGFVRYDDIFHGHFISGFSLVFDPVGQRFVRRGDGAYNYEREEKSKDIPVP
jgi:hypothetical protein